MPPRLVEIIALTVLFLVVFFSILYAYYTGYWTDVVCAHTAAGTAILLDTIDKKKKVKT